jgi:polyisoprenoid-binding protein YceI
MRAFHLLLLAFLLSAPPVAVHAQAVRYELDPVHTRVLFAVSHAGFSHALGTISGSTGELWFDPDDWSSARLQASVPIGRADLGDPKWNRAALANNLLDADDHPLASFESTRVEPVDATHAALFGTLTLRGVSKEVRLDVTLNAARRHPMPPFRRTVGFSATAVLSRKDFGIDAWPSVIGDAVELRIEAEATRARQRDEAPGDESEATVPAPTPADDTPMPPEIAPPPPGPPQPAEMPEATAPAEPEAVP